MIHIYCGEGKGKTTAAVGLAVRAAGRGKRVAFAQFLKSGDSGERAILGALPTVTLLAVPEKMTFTFRMNEEEKATAALRQQEILKEAAALADQVDLLVLDELCAALTSGMAPLEGVLDLLDSRPEGLELVITGRNPPQVLLDRAHYITEMEKLRHPFDQGIPAREGVEW